MPDERRLLLSVAQNSSKIVNKGQTSFQRVSVRVIFVVLFYSFFFLPFLASSYFIIISLFIYIFILFFFFGGGAFFIFKVKKLVLKHGTNYKAMARDHKINVYQHTPAILKRKVEKVMGTLDLADEHGIEHE